MISFKEYVAEDRKEGQPLRTGIIDSNELNKHISKTKIAAIHRHPYFKRHVALEGHPVGYKFHRSDNGFEHVEASNGVNFKRSDGRTVKDMVRFDLSTTRHTVANAHHFTNTNGEKMDARYGGGLSYQWISSHKKDEVAEMVTARYAVVDAQGIPHYITADEFSAQRVAKAKNHTVRPIFAPKPKRDGVLAVKDVTDETNK